MSTTRKLCGGYRRVGATITGALRLEFTDLIGRVVEILEECLQASIAPLGDMMRNARTHIAS